MGKPSAERRLDDTEASAFLRALPGELSGTLVLTEKTAAVNAELSLDVVLGFSLPLTCAAGIALARDPAFSAHRAPAAYVRIGRAF